MSDSSGTELASPARARPRGNIPQPRDLIEELDDIKDLALKFRRVYLDRNGKQRSCAAPDFKAAISAIRCMAEILGMIREKPQFETDELVADAVRRALSDPELRKLVLTEIRRVEPKLMGYP